MSEVLDWPQTRTMFAHQFSDLDERRRSRWDISPNFMTPDILATYAYPPGFDIEISTGLFPDLGVRPRTEHRVYGISLRMHQQSTVTSETIDIMRLRWQIEDLSRLIRDDELTEQITLRDCYDQIVAEAERIISEHLRHI